MSLAWRAYRAAAPAIGALAEGLAVFTSPHERPLWRERMGDSRLPGGCDAWVHAASLGEALAVPPLLAALRAAQPGARFFLTATTRTGRARLAPLGAPLALAPLDSPQAARRFFAGVQPQRVLLLETELWPHWLLRARADGIPVAVVSARLSERSVRRYRRLGDGLRALIGGLAAVLCQGADDQRRWLALGAPPACTRVVGNLKSDGLPEPAPDRAAARAALGLDPARRLLVLGSLRPGEARLVARAWRSLPAPLRAAWQVVAVPRHARATAELQAEAAGAGVAVAAGAPGPDAWRWDDRAGVLVDWYRAGDVAVVGGSLAPWGGHNPLEPAACGAAVIVGPHHAAQRDGVRALAAAGAVRIAAGGDDLAAALAELLGPSETRATRAAAALAVARAQRGSAARAVAQLAELGLWDRR